ncbi:SusC/RagA family TonB-linked outer membrane protein [Emticicia aquatilis]|uniref:SusC/RagA family TonB-linked outer membrane protein n=1 Tax=Emticicia aquatilis TaxID=1537369 RepID=A0A916YDR9_9BACT|nr:TonB-dependent receptor [Emticicia aquatilis]GGD41462.1 SusC/RagA family TonB-linked outer membrane protein [Emticicia aquatilis]
MNKLLRVSLACLFLFVSFWGNAQTVVTGKVTSSEDGSPLPGVSITIKGTTKGTSTDEKGAYKLSVPANSTLQASFIGFTDAEQVVGNRSVVDFTLTSDVKSLNEVVVTGYGSQIKRDLTGNIVKIKSSEIQDMPVTTFEQSIQGKAAGVQINQGTGKLAQGIQVRVRGQSSVSASNEPLYVLDGIPLTQGDLSSNGGDTNPLVDINPQDIESIEILKDASAGAIYGARAANGVVLITTKRGKSGTTKITFGMQYGKSKPTNILKFLNTKQYMDFYRIAAANSDAIDGYDAKDPDSYTAYMESFFETQSLGTLGTANQADTDWGSLAFQDAPSKQYDLNLSGGSDKTTFFISGQLLDQTGILLGNAFSRYTGRMNLNHKVSERLNIGMNMSIARSLNERVSGDRQFDNPLQLVALPPMTPATDPTTGLPVGTPPGDISIPVYYNGMINIGNAYYNTTVHRNISSVYGEYTLLKGLRFRTEFALDLLNQQEEQYYNSKTQRNFGAPLGYGFNRFVRVENYNTNNYFVYDNVFGKHGINATAGLSYQNSQTKTSSAEGKDFPSDAYRMIASAARKTDASSSQSDYRFASYFTRLNYKFNDKYLLGLSARVDGSSRFGADNRYGFFPAVSAGWVLSEESFLKNIELISFLKLRASWGKTGNAEIGNFPQLGLFTGDAGYGTLPGQRPSQLANPSLGWESTQQIDIGLDFGILKNRINGEIDYYEKNTTGLLLNVNVPGTTGFATQVKNVGALTNKGFEFVLNTDNLVGQFKWKTSLNASTNKNKITDLQGQVIEGGLANMSRAVEGQPLGTFFTVEYAGVDPANGDALFYKNTKNADGSIDRSTTKTYSQAQRTVIGSPLPKWVAGVTNTFSYKGFELSVFLNGVFGNKLNFYGVGRFSSANGRFEDNQTVNQLAAWTPQNTNTNVPQARLFFNNGAQASSRFIEDGSFVRLRNVTFAYNLPKSLISKIKLSNVRLYVTGQNLLTFTKYSGWDPEVNADDVVSNIALGYDFYTTPQAKTFMGGLNISF